MHRKQKRLPCASYCVYGHHVILLRVITWNVHLLQNVEIGNETTEKTKRGRRSVMRGDYQIRRDKQVITVRDFKRLAQMVAPRALDVMKRLMSSAESEQVQLQAAAHILDRAYGKPMQLVQEAVADWTESFSEQDMALAIASIERRIARRRASTMVDVQPSTETLPEIISVDPEQQ